MSTPKTRIVELGFEVETHRNSVQSHRTNNPTAVFFVSPPLNHGEVVALSIPESPMVAVEKKDLSKAQERALQTFGKTRIAERISILAEKVTIDGTEGTILLYKRASEDISKVTEVAGHLGQVVSGIREHEDFELDLNPNRPYNAPVEE